MAVKRFCGIVEITEIKRIPLSVHIDILYLKGSWFYDLIVRCGEPKMSAYPFGGSVLAETTTDEVEITERAVGSPAAQFFIN